MTRRPDAKEPEPEGGRAAERLRDFLRRRSIEGDEPPPPSESESESEPAPEQDRAQDDSDR
jgi:hypothetical protein